jgi:hypothetical protein
MTLAALSIALPAFALPPVTGKVILTISGQISEKNAGETAAFDLSMLENLPQKTFTTKTPWDKEPVKFTGPLLRDVLAAAKASGTTLKVTALNDYKTIIPLADTQKFDMVLAYKINDKTISIRTKGPLFIIYPFDTNPELQSTVYYERSAWQLKSIDVQ